MHEAIPKVIRKIPLISIGSSTADIQDPLNLWVDGFLGGLTGKLADPWDSSGSYSFDSP
jgi:hypothetical protein